MANEIEEQRGKTRRKASAASPMDIEESDWENMRHKVFGGSQMEEQEFAVAASKRKQTAAEKKLRREKDLEAKRLEREEAWRQQEEVLAEQKRADEQAKHQKTEAAKKKKAAFEEQARRAKEEEAKRKLEAKRQKQEVERLQRERECQQREREEAERQQRERDLAQRKTEEEARRQQEMAREADKRREQKEKQRHSDEIDDGKRELGQGGTPQWTADQGTRAMTLGRGGTSHWTADEVMKEAERRKEEHSATAAKHKRNREMANARSKTELNPASSLYRGNSNVKSFKPMFGAPSATPTPSALAPMQLDQKENPNGAHLESTAPSQTQLITPADPPAEKEKDSQVSASPSPPIRTVFVHANQVEGSPTDSLLMPPPRPQLPAAQLPPRPPPQVPLPATPPQSPARSLTREEEFQIIQRQASLDVLDELTQASTSTVSDSTLLSWRTPSQGSLTPSKRHNTRLRSKSSTKKVRSSQENQEPPTNPDEMT